MGTRKSIRIGVFLTVAAVALLAAANSAAGQTAPIRYVFGTNSFTDSKGQVWAPVSTSYLSEPARQHWSNCAKNATFNGTPDPGLYQEQLAEDSGDLVLTVPVPNGPYIVNLYFAEPCFFYTAGMRSLEFSSTARLLRRAWTWKRRQAWKSQSLNLRQSTDRRLCST